MKKEKQIKVGITGLGPVGLILATHLHEAGCEVHICDRDKIKLNLIRREGVKMHGVIKKHVFFENIIDNFSELLNLNLDFLFFSVKSYHMKPLLESHAEQIAAMKEKQLLNCSFISAQNGLDVEERLTGVFGEEKTMRMVINFAGNLNAPNVVKVTFFNPPNYIASIDDSRMEKAEIISNVLGEVGLKTHAITAFELLRREWEKTILNSSLSALCGIGKFTIKEAMEFPGMVEIIEQVIEEAVEVAAAEKVHFDDDFIRNCMRYLKKAGNHFPSLAVDLINNRQTEIDYFNGKIVEYGRKHYVRTPLNLVFANMVRSMTQKSLVNQLAGKGLTGIHRKGKATKALSSDSNCFLGVDLGSAYTKFTVIDDHNNVLYSTALKTLNRDKIALHHVMDAIRDEYPIRFTCATGYGRKHFSSADIIKTEINCAAMGVSYWFHGEKNIIDIGGEDIKVIRCDKKDNVENFYLNDKCAAGTGSFITEVAERAEINPSEMSDLASKSNFNQELNSFCTVFAKTEIMGWLFDGKSINDISRGVYHSITNRVVKMRIHPGLPIYLIGGVIANHPFLKEMLSERFGREAIIVENPQFIVSFGAALIAKGYFILQANRKKNHKAVDTL